MTGYRTTDRCLLNIQKKRRYSYGTGRPLDNMREGDK